LQLRNKQALLFLKKAGRRAQPVIHVFRFARFQPADLPTTHHSNLALFGSAERCFSVPATSSPSAARSFAQDGRMAALPQAARSGLDQSERSATLAEPGDNPPP
jgi:hypothetical protein